MTDKKGENMDQKDLKIAALKEEVSNIASTYADKVADLRINITVLSQRLEAEQQKVKDLHQQVASLQQAEVHKAPGPDFGGDDEEFLEGEVVDG